MKGIDQRIAELPPDKLALLLERLGEARPARAEQPGPPAITRRRWEGPVRPLSFAQERLWFLDQLAPGNSDYNVPAALRLRGRVDRRCFAQALEEVVRRHEVLRVSFREVDGQPVGRVEEDACPVPAQVDLGGLRPPEQEAQAERLARAEALRPFDLARAPLLRVRWLDLHEGERILLFTVHHIVCDGWSVEILTRDLVELYRELAAGRPSPLPELELQYADYAQWHRERLAGEGLERELEYWRRQLRGASPRIELRTARIEGPGPERRGADQPFSLPPATVAALKALGREELATPFMVLAALFVVLLYDGSGQEDLCLGANAAHRGDLEMEDLIGFFVNQIVLRIRPAASGSFRELLRQVRDVTQEAHAHQELPFERLVEDLAPERSAGGNPLFAVKIDFQEERPPVELPGVEISSLDVVPTPLRCDLLLTGAGATDRIDGALSYDGGRLRAEGVREMAAKLVRIADGVAAEPDLQLRQLLARVSREAERQRAAERERLDRIGGTKLRSTRRKSVRLST